MDIRPIGEARYEPGAARLVDVGPDLANALGHPGDTSISREDLLGGIDRTYSSGFGRLLDGAWPGPCTVLVRTVDVERWIEFVASSVGDAGALHIVAADATDALSVTASFRASQPPDSGILAIIDAVPDAALGVDQRGIIVVVNPRVEEYFRFSRAELLGQPVEALIPDRFRSQHEGHRQGYEQQPHARSMGSGLNLSGRRKDGTEFPIDVSLSPIQIGDAHITLAMVRDYSERKRADEDARLLHEHQLLRQQALEINDVIIQGLATATYTVEAGDTETGIDALRATLASARGMMSDLLDGPAADLGPGDLLRGRPARVLPPRMDRSPPAQSPTDETPPSGHPTSAISDKPRIAIADDTPDIRLVLRMALRNDFEIAGEAENGREAIELVEREHPDAILLDLAMPVMDGLQAIPRIREAWPSIKIVVVSGYGSSQMSEEALNAGADAYLEKGRPIEWVAETLRELIGVDPPDPVTGPEEEETAAVGRPTSAPSALDAGNLLLHELGAPLTVLEQVAETLRERMDRLPSAAVRELLDAMSRNVEHIGTLANTFAEARRLAIGDLALITERCDVGQLAREVVSDLRSISPDIRVEHHADPDSIANIDPVRVRQILTNLVTNGLKFGRTNVQVRVRADDARGDLTLSVTNDGPAIPNERIDDLFTPFERLGVTRIPGLGLGLYVARELARAHGGDVSLARNEPGAVSFTIALPVGAPTREDADNGATT